MTPPSAKGSYASQVESVEVLKNIIPFFAPSAKNCGSQIQSDMRTELEKANDVIMQLTGMVKNLQNEISSLREDNENLSGENEELLNDFDDVVTENEELKRHLEASRQQSKMIGVKGMAIVEERNALAEQLDKYREQYLDPDEVSELVNRIKGQMKRKEQQSANERKSLENKIKQLMFELDEKDKTIKGMSLERNQVKLKMEDMSSVMRSLNQIMNPSGPETSAEQKRKGAGSDTRARRSTMAHV